MDVTPHDLRNAELREAFRGYRPDEVEELLERAAITLERMHERNRQLQEKIAGARSRGVDGQGDGERAPPDAPPRPAHRRRDGHQPPTRRPASSSKRRRTGR